MTNQSDITIKEKYGTYQIESKPSGLYAVWNECDNGKWIGLAVTKTVTDAHKVIKAYEQYLDTVNEVI